MKIFGRDGSIIWRSPLYIFGFYIFSVRVGGILIFNIGIWRLLVTGILGSTGIHSILGNYRVMVFG